MKWTMVPLSEIITERQEIPSPEDLVLGKIKIISKISFDTGLIQTRTDGETRTGMILVRPGDLVVSGINAAKGAIAIYGQENKEPLAATIHYGAYMLIPKRANISYIWWLLRSKLFRALLTKYVPGGIKTELKAKRLLTVPIPLPLLEDQNKLVTWIEDLEEQIKVASVVNKQAIGETEALERAVLRQVSESVRIDGTLNDALEAPPRNGWSAKSNIDERGIAVLSLGAVTGFHYRPTEYKRISPLTQLRQDVLLRRGDLLVTRSNTSELVGHAAIYNGYPTPCIYPDLMMRLKIRENFFQPEFIWYWLQTPLVREFIKQKAKGTSPTMKKISQGVVMAVPFPSALPMSEQRRIVAELAILQAKLNALKHLQADTATELAALMPSILGRAFKGGL